MDKTEKYLILFLCNFILNEDIYHTTELKYLNLNRQTAVTFIVNEQVMVS